MNIKASNALLHLKKQGGARVEQVGQKTHGEGLATPAPLHPLLRGGSGGGAIERPDLSGNDKVEQVSPTTPPQVGERVGFERLLANLRGEIELDVVERVAVAIECARTNGTQDWHRVNSMTLARAAIAALATPSQRDGGGE